MCRFFKALVANGHADDDTGRVEIIVKCLALSQEFRTKKDVVTLEFFSDALRITDRNGGFDDHNGIGIDGNDLFNDRFHRRGIKVVFVWIVVGRCRNSKEYGLFSYGK